MKTQPEPIEITDGDLETGLNVNDLAADNS
jgi:hypothetical protein